MEDPICSAIQGWDRAVHEAQRLEREWRALASTAPGREELRRRCDLQAADADDLFDRALRLLRSQGEAAAFAMA